MNSLCEVDDVIAFFGLLRGCHNSAAALAVVVALVMFVVVVVVAALH